MTERASFPHPPLPEFLRGDFDLLDPAVIARCMGLNGQRLYLSGATGFFGSNLLALFAELSRRGAKFEVTGLSRNPGSFLGRYPWARDQPWLDWQTGDGTERWPGNGEYDLLIHAATSTDAASHVDKARVFDEIIAVTRHALDFAARHGVRRILLTGSGAQYGPIPPHFADGVPESSGLACDPARPSSAYGEAKRVSELLVALHAEKTGCAVVNTRCFAFVGPGLPLDGHFAIGNFIRDAIAGRPIALSSAGESVRSYLYSADLAVWLVLLLLEASGVNTFNVGSDRGIRVADLAGKVRDCVNPKTAVRIGRPGESDERSYYLPSIARAREKGLDVWTGLDRAIMRTAAWHGNGATA
jgi:nucleoside-diphosphate-sugar epimerase